MRFDRLDLNLLVVLDALIAARSVSGAAGTLNLSQPAVSGALARLRDYFQDDLLVLTGRRMMLTPKAEQLASPVRRALIQVRNEITQPSAFDPATAERCFRIVASDYAFSILLARCVALSAVAAPGISFEIDQPDRFSAERLERGEIDILFTLDAYRTSNHPHLALFGDEEVVICWSGADYTDLDVDEFFLAGHAVAVFGRDHHPTSIDEHLASHPRQRRIEVRLPSFTALPEAIVGTQRLATMHRRFAQHLARLHPIRILPSPFTLPRITEIVQWHSMRHSDEGVRWLTRLLASEAAALS